MNDLNGGLNFTSQLDNSKLVTDAAKAKATLKGVGDTAVVQGSAVERAFSSAYGMIGAGAVASIGLLGKQILDVTAKFEKFGIVLRNTLGDAKGTEALAMIANFAATTPFQLDEVTGAFIKMANQGFVPTRQEMVKLGDLASSTGKSFDMLAEAILDAQTGEMERLKEFGIKASVNGEKVTFAFKEQKTTVENTASSIRAYILSLGELNGVAGANEKISASLTGQISNLGDKIAAMYNKIGTENKGLLYSAVGTASTLVDNYEAVGDVITGLIAVFGAYKLAVMYVAYEQKILAATNALIVESNGFLVASEARAIVMKERSLLAQERLNASMLANPYVLAAMAITALGYAIYKTVTYQTELEKALSKASSEIETEKDKVAQLFAALNNAKEGTEGWKKAKDDILSQYGNYLTEQQKELLGTKNQAEAQKAVNDGLRENIALRVQKESLDQISANFNPKIADAKGGLSNQLKDKYGLDKAAGIEQQMEPLIQNIKIAVDHDALVKAVDEWNVFSNKLKADLYGNQVFFTDNLGKIGQAALQYQNQSVAVINAFNVQMKKNEETGKDPVLTTYDAQIKALQEKKKKLEAELEKLKNTPGVDPMKAIIEKQGQIDEVNKQLGIKEKAAKKEKEDVKTTIELSKEYLAIQQQIIDKTKELQEANKKKDADKGIQLTKDIDGLQKQLTTLVSGGEKIDPLGATVATKMLDKQLRPMKQLTEEERKQLELKAKKASQDAIAADGADELSDKIKVQSEYFYQAADAAQYLSQQIGDSNQGLADMVNGIANVAGQLGDLAAKGAFTKEGMGKVDAISSAISGATQLVGMMVGQAAENKRVMADYYASVIKQQRDYNLSLNEQLRLNSEINGSVFFTDFKARLSDASKALKDASEKQKEAMAEFYGSEAIIGKKNVVSGGNVLKGVGAGAALGAGIGTLILPGIGSAIGAGIGAVVGGITGIFAKKKRDVVAPLLQTYPDLIKANGEFNTELAKTLVENEKVTAETKATLENVIKWEEAAKAAKEQIKSVISDMAGSLGDDLRSALVDAFRDGGDAAVEFGKKVTGVLEDILSQQIFNAVFGPALKQLQADMEASSTDGGDGNWMDDIQRFLMQIPSLTGVFNEVLQGTVDMAKSGTTYNRELTAEEDRQRKQLESEKREAEDRMQELRNRAEAGKIVTNAQWAQAQENLEFTIDNLKKFNDSLNLSVTTPGMDLFGNDATRKASAKGFATASQDSIDELNGRFTAMQGHTAYIPSIAEGMKILQNNSAQVLKHLSGIEKNTDRLEAIEKSIGSVKDGIEIMNLKGITLKK